MIYVSKFGGSSLSCASQFLKVKNIVGENKCRKAVVVSALGKRNSDDTKVTDLLYILHAHLKYKASIDEIWEQIYTRFIGVRDELKIDYDIKKDLDIIKDSLDSNTDEAYLVSRGEYLTAKLMSAYLGYKFIDARDVIKFNDDGELDSDSTNYLISKAYDDKGIVIPGFYGSYHDSKVKLFSRGGSDITGAILANALKASLYENWTDVSGVLMADPRIVKNPKSISELTYLELREMSYMGANVLHEETIFPVQELNIPINLKNTNRPEDVGTFIKKESNSKQVVTGITGIKGFLAITIYKKHLSNEIGFMRKVLEIFEKKNISIEHVPTGIDSISVVADSESINKYKTEILQELNQNLKPDLIEISDEMALIAIVGRNMKYKIGVSGIIFGCLKDNNISVKMIAQGPNELDIIIGVLTKDYDKTIISLYNGLNELVLED